MSTPLVYVDDERGYVEVDKSREYLDGMDPEERTRLPVRAVLPECRANLKSVNEAKHTVDFIISTEKPVRDSLWDPPASLAADGMVTNTRYDDNPVVCFMHDYVYVVGRSEKLWTLGKKNLSRVYFDYEDEVGAWLFGKVLRGFIRMASVGFRKLQWYDIGEGEKDKKTGLTGPVRRVTKWELIEWSIVSIGANPDALGRSLAGVLGPRDALRTLAAPYRAAHTDVCLRKEHLRPAVRLEPSHLLQPLRLTESNFLN